MIICLYCGKINLEGALFCERCNELLVEIDYETKPKEKAPLVLFEENKAAFEAPETVIIQGRASTMPALPSICRTRPSSWGAPT